MRATIPTTVAVSTPAATTPPSPPTAGIDPSWTEAPVEVYVPKLNIRRNVLTADGTYSGVQASIDSCTGATLVDWFYTPVYLAAHRTHCGTAGFGGVETLTKGDVVYITYANGAVGTYYVDTRLILTLDGTYTDPANGAPVALQTSKSSTQAWLITCSPTP